MNRSRARELLPIILAFADGKTVQYRYLSNEWMDCTVPNFGSGFNDVKTEYRIKPEPREFWIQIINMDDEKINGECWIKQAGWVGEGDELPDFNGEIVKVREIIGEGDENE